MKQLTICVILIFLLGCNEKQQLESQINYKEQIVYASGLSIQKYESFSLVIIQKPWPKSQKKYKYILHKKDYKIPDSLLHWQSIQVPIENIVVTSTTHIPPLEMMNLEEKLIGFPNTNYISSIKTRALINAGKIREVGTNQALNTEVLLELQPSVLMGFGVEGQNSAYDLLMKSGIPVLYNGDWVEQDPLGRAEWIKLFGALFCEENRANLLFKKIEKSYQEIQSSVVQVDYKPRIMSGAMYQDQWYAPQGKSWSSKLLQEAAGNYIWAETSGVGSLAMSFETVIDNAQNADIWIGPGQFTSYNEMIKSNPNYRYFKAFQNKKIYSFSTKKGTTGGVIYYEVASSRPDLVLKDLVKIIHPQLIPNDTLYFFEPLK